MKRNWLRSLAVLVVFLTGFLLAAAPGRDVEATLRQGNAAFRVGDYASAIALYEEVEKTSTDPKQLAFNIAVARYCLAQEKPEGRGAELRDAEKLFQAVRGSARDLTEPRQARALYGLGLCLLSRLMGREDLKRAEECFEECRQLESAEADLRQAAMSGLEMARLRLAQYQAPQPRDREDPPNKEESKPEKRDTRPQPSQPGDGMQQGFDKGNKTTSVAVKADVGGPKPQSSNDPPPPGSNPSLPPVPDQADLQPLSAQDAAAHLDQASRRILEDAQAHRRGKPRSTVVGIRDW